MDYPQYKDIEELIKEYEEDFNTIRKERIVMRNYPKVLVMSTASFFECQIKKRCEAFINNPKLPLDINYPKIFTLHGNKPKVDQIFAQLCGYENHGVEFLDAKNFYDFFGGTNFESIVKLNYNCEKSHCISSIDELISNLKPLYDRDENKYGFDYVKQCELKEEVEKCSFEDAEKSYLYLKLKRNRLAHDYINGLSDTFEDLTRFYNKAVIYVVSLEKAIIELTK